LAKKLSLKIKFQDEGILDLALTHTSYCNEHPEYTKGSNERLEFLGDALLDMVVGYRIYELFPDVDEGHLTQLRSVLVRDEMLARIARELDLGSHLRMGRGEAASGGRSRESNVAAALEALFAAVFLDKGYKVAAAYILRVLASEIERVLGDGIPSEPKSLLQELAHQQGHRSPKYRVINIKGPDHRPTYSVEVLIEGKVMGRGIGHRVVEAERQAAMEALTSIS